MTVSEYLVDCLVRYKVTDVFGLPGGVVLDFLYAIEARTPEITPHLSYHEQSAAFEAVGYAQANGCLGVAYATRGPGFTNMLTAIADAYCDSVPTLFITAHASALNPSMRLSSNQEIDTCAMVANITKYSKRIDSLTDFVQSVEEACFLATSGRKGPVFLDIASQLWRKEVVNTAFEQNNVYLPEYDPAHIANILAEQISHAERPVILIGDGINQNNLQKELIAFSQKTCIPVISSRYAHNVMGDSKLYYGYIGGFGVRYANFILSKADLILSLGNRLNFPLNSDTYRNIPYQAKFIRFEIDEGELTRDIPNALTYQLDIKNILYTLSKKQLDYGDHTDWINVCNVIRDNLWHEDVEPHVSGIARILDSNPEASLVNDVGNNEFWVSRACAYTKRAGNILYSKSFATLGSSMVKAIGAYYATCKPVICFIGDQGVQMNSQELHYISQHKLPIMVVVLNNNISGMIRDKELTAFGKCVHSTSDSGFTTPDIQSLADCYGISYFDCSIKNPLPAKIDNSNPILVNYHIDENIKLAPTLPRGHKPQDMVPALDNDLYNFLDNL